MNGFEMDNTQNIVNALKAEIERVQKLVDSYKGIPELQVTIMLMRADIASAMGMLSANNVRGMIRTYQALCGWKDNFTPKQQFTRHTEYCTPCW